MEKVVVGFSGGLDTTYCVKYLTLEKGLEVHSVIVNTGGFSEEELKENFETLRSALMSAKPNSFKRRYLNSISISSTLGPGIKIGTE